MKQFFRFFSLLLLAVMTTASAYADRQKPEIANYPAAEFVTDHGYFIYNVAADKFLSKGEAWGTQSCVVDFENDASGNKPFTYQIKNDKQENTDLPAGTYYLWSADAAGKGWIARINTDSKAGSTNTCFSDGNAGHFSALKVNWVIAKQEDGTFLITVPADDPNGMYIEGCALGVNPEHYSTTNPTYAVYWDINYVDAEDANYYPDGVKWMLYDADAFNEANEIYSVAAPALLAAIEKAQANGIDVTEAQTVYNNDNATLEEINAAIDALKVELAKYPAFNNPVDVTSQYITNPAPYANINGWTAPKGNPNAFDSGNKNAEFWNLSGYSLEQTIHLPAGVYKLTAIALSREGHHGYLYAGDYKVELAHVASSVVNNRTQANSWFNEGNGVNELFFPMAEEGDITIKLVADETTGDHWTVWREFKLDYLGNDVEKSYKPAIRLTFDENWADEFASDVTYTQSYYDAVSSAVASIETISTVEEANQLFNAPAAALQALRDNVAAWAAFGLWYDTQYEGFYSTGIAEGLGAMGDYYEAYEGAATLEDWLVDDPGPAWRDYALALAPVDEEITTEMLTTHGMEWFEGLYKETVLEILSNEILPGTDITKGFLKNPDFISEGSLAGWTVENGAYCNNGRSYGSPTWYNSSLPRVLERWDGDFNIHQDIILPKTGCYRVSTRGFYRCCQGDKNAWTVWKEADEEGRTTGDNTICAFFYADQLQKAFPNICNRQYTLDEITGIAEGTDAGGGYDEETLNADKSSGGKVSAYPYDFLLVEGNGRTDDGDDPNSLFIPNGVYSADYIFTHAPYEESYKMEFAFVAREKQPMRLGIKGENVGVPANSIGWTIFDQLTLIYEGADETIVKEPLDAFVAQAEALLANPMSSEAKDSLAAAVAAGKDAADGDAMLAAYLQLDEAIATANTSVAAYEKLVAAQKSLAEAIKDYGPTAADDALTEANALKAVVDGAVENGTVATADVQEKVDEVATVVAKLQIPDFTKNAYPYDLTFAIKNPKFAEALVDGKVPGWSYNEDENYAALSVANNIAEGYVSGTKNEETGETVGSKKGFNIWQTITQLPDGRKLPAGVYEVHAQGIARLCNNDSNVAMGFADVDAAVRDAAYEEHADQMPYFYANMVKTWIANPYVLPTSDDEKDLLSNNLGLSDWYTLTFEGDIDMNTGELRQYFIANNRSQLAQRFSHSRYNEDGEADADLTKKSPWYDNVITCVVSEEGVITFGWATDFAAPGTWAPMTNFRLYFVAGTDDPRYAEMITGINEVNKTAGSTIKAVYSIDGRQVNGLQRGLNIVKTNGAVKKVIVK
ncbi:MAG: hypothetical protein IJS97_00230 [Prevotella sp.]|nr:hypothetical protein [Prevotella sp.]